MEETLQALRTEYELSVGTLWAMAASMREAGVDVETMARAVHAERRALAIKFKALTPEPQRRLVEAHTIAAYGNPIGPEIDDLRAKGRSWEQIIASACRPGLPPRA
jgi:hypothetical protein